MEVRINNNKIYEIVVDNIAIGFIVTDDDSYVERAEIYDNQINNLYDSKLLYEFIKRINEYDWAD